MKKTFAFLFLCFLLLQSLSGYSQNNRRNTKKSVAYRSTYQRISIGSISSHTFEIREGTLWAWGGNNEGQLGDGTLTTRTIPTQIGAATNWINVATGQVYSIGLRADGTLWAWGRNAEGQLGDGTTTNRNTPIQIGTDNDWIAIATGAKHTLALKSNGSLWAWGSNSDGQLGIGSTTSQKAPIQVGTDQNWTNISAGYHHSFCLKSDGTLWAWGLNNNGRLGDGTTTSSSSPIQSGTDNKWTMVSAGADHSIGLKSDGTLWAWGFNAYGQLGDGSTTNRTSAVQIGTDKKWVYICAGLQHSSGLKSDGTLWVWGWNTFGQIGDSTLVNRTSPLQIGTDVKWISISGGYGQSIGMKSDGTLWSWGLNSNGQLGDSTTISKRTPTNIGVDNKWISATAGNSHSLGLKSNGSLWAWGNNGMYTLGDGTNIIRSTPTRIGNDDKWISVIAGLYIHSLAIKSNGTLWAWGYNNASQLGDGSATTQSVPIQIGSDNKWVSVSAGDLHSLGLKSDGTIWGWGANQYGQLGQGNTSSTYPTPVQIGTDNKWVSIAAGFTQTFGIKSDGTLWGCGTNGGSLGDGTIIDRNTMVQIGTDNKWVKVTPFFGFVLGLKANGTLWAWGQNDKGQLGDGSTTPHNIPTQVGTDTKWIDITVSTKCGHGIKVDGTQWAWGSNPTGQFGNNSTIQQLNPVQISSVNSWIAISGGQQFCLGVKADRTKFCATGTNHASQFGDGTILNDSIYKCNTNSTCAPPPPGVSNKTICKGTSTTLIASGLGVITWYNAAIGGTYLGGGSNFTTPVLNSTTTYYVQDSTCSVSVSRTVVVVTVNPTPSANPGIAKTICKGYSSSVGSVAISGNTYQWTSSPAGFTSTVANPLVNPTVTTWYYLTETITSTGCFKRDSVKITVNPLPASNVGTAKTICAGSGIMIGSTAVSGNTYAWTSIPSGFTSNLANPVVNPNQTTRYNLVETITATGCSKSDTVSISIKPLPNVNTTKSNFTISAIQTGAIYQWVKCPAYSILPSATNQSHTATVNGDYAVIVTQNGCSDTSNCVTIAGVGMDNSYSNFKVDLIPNPNNGIFNITISKPKENTHFEIYNCLGELVYSRNNVVEINTVDISDKANALYIIKIFSDNSVYYQRLIKQ